ncbi:methyl-accepting chemotaxis protein [Rubrivivax albus]|nr:methyl-accepting chemotaxis protein [Rubrivivax albus]
MRLLQQILALGIVGAVLTGVAGAIGIVASSHMGDALGDALGAGHALQASQAADMMHDAIRGDAQLALLGSIQNQPDDVAAARDGLKDHAETMRSQLDRLASLPIDGTVREILDKTRPAVEDYVQTAQSMIDAAGSGGPEAVILMQPRMQASFEVLEEDLEALSDALVATGTAMSAAAQASVDRTRLAIGVAMAVSTLALLGAAMWLAGLLVRPMRHAVDAAERLAQGDLTAPIQPQGNDETKALLTAFARMQAQLAGIVREVQGNADQVAGASTQIAQGNMDLSNRTESQASALQQTAATMSQLGDTVRHNAENAEQARQLADGAVEVADRGGAVMARVVETMSGIDQSSRRIADIIGTIDGIAFQTNILALNAAVEAARAGEQGRGFAVVAGEVRQLAQRSAEAAREIKSLVTASVERVQAGTGQVDEAGRTVSDIVTAIKRVNDLVGEISAASRSQSGSVSEVGAAVAEMDRGTQQSAALVEETAAAAAALKNQAESLVRAVGAFRV